MLKMFLIQGLKKKPKHFHSTKKAWNILDVKYTNSSLKVLACFDASIKDMVQKGVKQLPKS